MRPILRGKYLDERLSYSRKEAADNHIRCHECGGTLATLAPWSITPGRYRIRLSISRSKQFEFVKPKPHAIIYTILADD